MNIQSIIEEAQENANEQGLTLSEYLEDVLSDILYEALLGFQGTPLEAERYKEALSEALNPYIQGDKALCNDCGEPIGYCNEREQWRHVDLEALPCFLVSGSL